MIITFPIYPTLDISLLESEGNLVVMGTIKEKIQKWWNSSPCCSKVTNSPWGSKEFFEQVDSYKDTFEPFTDEIADYPCWRGKRTLEIGIGLGKDFSRFAANGALATGIDLSEKSLSLTKKRLEIFHLRGNLCLADAENLPFKDKVFDLIFSWGVLHHTPDTKKAIDEAYRCLKQNGIAIIMLYSKYSLVNFGYFITSIKIRFVSFLGVKKTSTAFTPFEKLSNSELLAAFTDGIGNPLSKVYSREEAKQLFLKFKNINIRAYESRYSPYAMVLNSFKALEKYLGWFMVIKAKK